MYSIKHVNPWNKETESCTTNKLSIKNDCINTLTNRSSNKYVIKIEKAKLLEGKVNYDPIDDQSRSEK